MKFYDPLRWRLWLGQKIYGKQSHSSIRVSPWTVLKAHCPESELEGIRYVTQHTSIPVPRLRRVHRRGNVLYLELEYVDGVPLGYAWRRGDWSPEHEVSVMNELGEFVQQMRNLTPLREGAVGSALLGEAKDARVGYGLFGPLESVEDFHTFLRGNLMLEKTSEIFGEEIARCHARQYQTKFTHGDLTPRNIIVKNGKIAAILDWESAGWYPEWWEYRKANFCPLEMPGYYEELARVLDRYDEELEADRILMHVYGGPNEH